MTVVLDDGGPPDAELLAEELDGRIRALPDRSVEAVRRVRREFSKRLRVADAGTVLALAMIVSQRHRWVAYELVYHHRPAASALDAGTLERLGTGLDDWGSVDAFGCLVSGPAWRRGLVPDDVVRGWAASPDRWWRRAALVSTVPLNVRARGGTGDPGRTLDICALLIADRDDLVVKALSWALRELVFWDRDAVQGFLDGHRDELAPRVLREVGNKLRTGLKNP